MDIKKMAIGMASCLVGRVSFTGDLGYEICVSPEFQCYLMELLLTEGKELGIRLFGLRALNVLRLEKSYGSWSTEFRTIYGPLEAGLNHFVSLNKEAKFIGKTAVIKENVDGGKLRLRTFVVEARDADVVGDEPIWYGDGSKRLGDFRRIRPYF